MKLTDYVIQFLADQNIDHVFGLTGGAALHLFDSTDKHPKMEAIFCHHEQAAALAAVAYARQRNGLGATIVTTGPAGTNTMTGLLAAWQDSIPCFFISGQSRFEHTSRGKGLRQLGTQEFDIISVVAPITKYAVMLERPDRIRYHLEKALYYALNGRPGPVWVDIPLNFQWVDVDVDSLERFNPANEATQSLHPPTEGLMAQFFGLLSKAQRPLVLVGYGVRLSHAEKLFEQFIKNFSLPFVSTWTASDILPTNHLLYTGRIGVTGQRGGNLAVQNCDLLICLGSHLNIPLTGTLANSFARAAKIVMVNIDQQELNFKADKISLAIAMDAKDFLEKTTQAKHPAGARPLLPWIKKCREYKKYNAVPKAWKDRKGLVDSYVFMDHISDLLNSRDMVVVDGGGTCLYASFQAFKVKRGQRLLVSGGICAMGTGLPESVGTCLASGLKRTICFSGDGSMQLNIQELETMVHHRLPIKIFVFNNDGYLAIRHTQNIFFKKHYVGTDKTGGVSVPDLIKVAKAYGLKTISIRHHKELVKKIEWTLKQPGPVLCDVRMNPKQDLIVQQGFDPNPDGTFSPRPLEDMSPFLSDEEFLKNMVITPLRKIVS